MILLSLVSAEEPAESQIDSIASVETVVVITYISGAKVRGTIIDSTDTHIILFVVGTGQTMTIPRRTIKSIQSEGGDILWIDEKTVAVGEGYRTNSEGMRQFRELLGNGVDEVIPVPLPHWTGPTDCLHLLSNVSPIDNDLYVVYSPLLTVPFRKYLLNCGIQLIEVPEEEYSTLGCNILALAPRKVIMVDGNPKVRDSLENQGVEVIVFDGSEICLKGTGGPTCLTRPLYRE